MTKLLWILLPVAVLSACSGDRAMRCEDDARYSGASSAAPLRIPDDLSVPDESEAISVPPGPASASPPEGEPGRCLERPPDFFENA